MILSRTFVRRCGLVAARLVTVVPSVGCVRGASPSRAASAPPRSPKEALYRLDFTISERDPNAAVGTSHAYTLLLEEHRTGHIAIGANVPLGAASQARMDVGLKVRFQIAAQGENLVLQTDTEMSALEEGLGVRKLSAEGDAFLRPGEPTVVASLDDLATHKRFQVTVTATKLD